MLSAPTLNTSLKYTLQFYTNSYHWELTSPNRSTLLTYFFRHRLWAYFKFQNIKSFGAYTNTLILSMLYKKYTALANPLNLKSPATAACGAVEYVQPIPILYFSFQKMKYNSFMILLLRSCVDYYSATKTTFDLAYGFVFFHPNYFLYNFINKYYFQVRNY
jgi:hypothetical protein